MRKETIEINESSYFSLIPAILYLFFILYSCCKSKCWNRNETSNLEINHKLLPETSREDILNQRRIPNSYYLKQRISILIIVLFLSQIIFEILFFSKNVIFVVFRTFSLIIWIITIIISQKEIIMKIKSKYYKNGLFWHANFLYDLSFLVLYYV